VGGLAVPERTLRWILVIVMFVTFFVLPPDVNYSNWWYTLEVLVGVATISLDQLSISKVSFILAAMLMYLPVPVILLVNVAVLQSSLDKRWKKRCRALLLVLCPLQWWWIWRGVSGGSRKIGMWPTPVVVTVAALLEVVFIISERKEKLKGTSSAVE
jgi:hypothetical protein